MNFLNILSIEFFFFFKKKKPQRIERIEPFLDITQRIEFFCWIYDSKNWTFFLNLTQRTVPSFFSWFKYLDLFHIKELNLLFYVTQILELFWKFLIQRNGPFFSGLKVFSSIKKNSQNWIFESDPQNWYFFELNRLISWIWRKELNRLISWVWRKDLNPFFKISLKELNFLMNMTQRTKVFLKVWLKELNSFLKRWLNEFNSFWTYASKNLTLFLIRLKELNFFMNMTQRFFFGKKLWLKESKLFLWI